jgi:hypothetical protein
VKAVYFVNPDPGGMTELKSKSGSKISSNGTQPEPYEQTLFRITFEARDSGMLLVTMPTMQGTDAEAVSLELAFCIVGKLIEPGAHGATEREKFAEELKGRILEIEDDPLQARQKQIETLGREAFLEEVRPWEEVPNDGRSQIILGKRWHGEPVTGIAADLGSTASALGSYLRRLRKKHGPAKVPTDDLLREWGLL